MDSKRLKVKITVSVQLECFHQKPYFLFDWRNKYINILDDMGVSKLSEHFHLKANLSFKYLKYQD